MSVECVLVNRMYFGDSHCQTNGKNVSKKES